MPQKLHITKAEFDADEYRQFLGHAGWGVVHHEHAVTGLKNSLMMFRAELDDELVGIARIIGDGAIYFYLQDMIIHPDFQGRGIGGRLLELAITEFKANYKGRLFLMSASGKTGFYEKYGFVQRPLDGPGMMLVN